MAVAHRGPAARGASSAAGVAFPGWGSRGQRTYLRRLGLRFALCLAVGLCLPGRQLVSEEVFVGAPNAEGRLRGSHAPPPRQRAAEAGGTSDDEAAALRAKVAELEKRLEKKEEQEAAEAPSARSALGAAAAAEVARRRQQPVEPQIQAAWEAVLEDLAEDFEKVKGGTVELMGGVQMKGANEDGTAPSIYRRKYDLLGASLKGQEAYLKACRRTVKIAKEKESVKKMVDLMKNGGGGLDRRQVSRETEKLIRSSKEANIFFSEIMPGVMEDPVADAINTALASIAIIAGVGLLLCCFFPPIPPPEE